MNEFFTTDFEIKIKKQKIGSVEKQEAQILDHMRSNVSNRLRGPIRSHDTTYFLST